MKKGILIGFILFAVFSVSAQSHKLLFKTQYGDFKVVLYDFTPNHQKMILDAVKDSVYHKALFNRIIKNFVVQGGEHDFDIAGREKYLPKEKHFRLASEFDKRAYHKIGALGAGRDDNLEKASFLNQIYFVVGKTVTEEDLNVLENKKGIKFTSEQRQFYLKNGGLPRLDGDYTVFGEVYEGLEVLLEISKTKNR
ncbi:MAG: peptidylprolyl isomerase [Flavobacteriaceae bacterium]